MFLLLDGVVEADLIREKRTHVISAFETNKSHLALHQNTTQKCSIEISLSTTLGAKTFIDMQYNLTFNQTDVNYG